MSVTPPLSYPQLHPDLGQTAGRDRKTVLETTPQDLSTALDEAQAEAIGLPKKKIHQVEQPQMVNVFVSTRLERLGHLHVLTRWSDAFGRIELHGSRVW